MEQHWSWCVYDMSREIKKKEDDKMDMDSVSKSNIAFG